jgi:hypothetical protein
MHCHFFIDHLSFIQAISGVRRREVPRLRQTQGVFVLTATPTCNPERHYSLLPVIGQASQPC